MLKCGVFCLFLYFSSFVGLGLSFLASPGWFLFFVSGFILYFFGFILGLAFPCFASGLLALPLCGAAPTFLCRRKEK